MFPVIHVGPLAIQAAGLFLILAAYLGIALSSRYATRAGVPAERLETLIMSGLIGYLVGGRLIFALTHWSVFQASPLDLISLNPSLFDATGGVAVAILAAWLYGQRAGLTLWPALDGITPFLATMMVGLSLAHLADGSAFGRESHLPWAIELHGTMRHPSQVYELLAALAILIGVALRRSSAAAGQRFWMFVAWSAGARLFLEAFRGDSTLILGGMRLEQGIAWGVLAVALAGLRYNWARGKRPERDE